jgi:hypothetical protein
MEQRNLRVGWIFTLAGIADPVIEVALLAVTHGEILAVSSAKQAIVLVGDAGLTPKRANLAPSWLREVPVRASADASVTRFGVVVRAGVAILVAESRAGETLERAYITLAVLCVAVVAFRADRIAALIDVFVLRGGACFDTRFAACAILVPKQVRRAILQALEAEGVLIVTSGAVECARGLLEVVGFSAHAAVVLC